MENAIREAVLNGEVSETPEIKVDVFAGPMGSCGFRTGKWPVTLDGVAFKVYESVPHALELAEQREKIESGITDYLTNKLHEKTENGKYRYTLQSERA